MLGLKLNDVSIRCHKKVINFSNHKYETKCQICIEIIFRCNMNIYPTPTYWYSLEICLSHDNTFLHQANLIKFTNWGTKKRSLSLRLNTTILKHSHKGFTQPALFVCKWFIRGHLNRYVKIAFYRHRLQRKPLISGPSLHQGTCVTRVPWCMSGPLTRAGGENVPGIPGACATRNFTYLARGP